MLTRSSSPTPGESPHPPTAPFTQGGRGEVLHLCYPRAAVWERNRIHFLDTIFRQLQIVTIARGTLEKW